MRFTLGLTYTLIAWMFFNIFGFFLFVWSESAGQAFKVFGSVVFFLLIFASIGIGILAFSHGLRTMNARRLIEGTPSSRVRGLAMGLVEIHGVAEAFQDKMVQSPFSKAKCLYYRGDIYETAEDYARTENKIWLAGSLESDSEFLINDGTGKVLVNPKGAKLDIPRTYDIGGWEMKNREEIPEQFRRADRVCWEYMIRPGDELYVLGTAGDNPHLKEGGARGMPDIMIRKGGLPFLISNKKESDIVGSLKWKERGELIFGGLVILSFVSLLLLAVYSMQVIAERGGDLYGLFAFSAMILFFVTAMLISFYRQKYYRG